MLISSDANGGEIVSATDDTRFYDDIGCLASDWPAHRANARAFVRVAGGRWSEAAAASYAQPSAIETPMGSGIAAFATDAEARAADRRGRALTFDDVVRVSGGAR
jgi:nitrous oxide reductase accessory protein NosL